MSGKTLAALAATMLCALPTMASAGSNGFDVIVDGRTGAQTRSTAVSVADLNLQSDRGYRTADSRIIRAAKRVCGYVNGSALPETNDYRTCYGNALTGGRDDLNALAGAARQG